MQIEVIKESSITFKLSDNGDDAADMFGSIMNKCAAEASKKGFRNMFNSEEKAFIREFTRKITYIPPVSET